MDSTWWLLEDGLATTWWQPVDHLLDGSATAWQLPDNCLMTTSFDFAWWLPDNCQTIAWCRLMTACQLSDNSLTTARWQTDYCMMMACKLSVTVFQLLEECKTAWRLGQQIAWQLPDEMTALLPDNWLGNAKLPDNCLTTHLSMPDNCQMTTWWLPDNYLTTNWQLTDN